MAAIEFRSAQCRRQVIVSKQQLRAINAEARRATKAVAALQHQAVVAEKQAKANHAQRRELETQAMNAQLDRRMAELTGLLTNSLEDPERFGFHSLRLELNYDAL